jgi:hypothetical protein
MQQYNRTFSELQSKATLWWSESLKEKNALANVLPLLLKTQDDFLHILILAKKEPLQVFDCIKAAQYPANLFLKHLAVLADYGGEPMQRLGRSFTEIFPQKKGVYYFDFIWKNEKHRYQFKAMPIAGLSSKKLHIDGEGLTKEYELDDLACDMIAILLHASTSNYTEFANLSACEIGIMLGIENDLMKFVKQRYINVSRITGGATANSLGQLAQSEVVVFLKKNLGEKYKIVTNGSILLEGSNNKNGIAFDILVEKDNKKIGIEISFQVTTNSTIERKSGQAADRQTLMHANGHYIAYVIDGAGNFQRSSAISTICKHSDCTVAYSISEFKVIATWIKSIL